MRSKFNNLIINIALLALPMKWVPCRSQDTVVSAINQKGDRLNFTEIAAFLGLPHEVYDVTTNDGYILTLFRIPGQKKPPTIFVHGIEMAADSWLLRGNTSLPFVLSNRGHDLWFLNVRGNIYSRRHVTLNPNVDAKFWDFSFHEHGYFDLAAVIDSVLDRTNSTVINSIAYSQGTTMLFVLTATRPEYNGKINIAIALAPIAYLNHLKPPTSLLIDVAPELNVVLKRFGLYEFFGYENTATKIVRAACSGPLGYATCALGFNFALTGFDPTELEPSFFRITNYYFPVGSSTKNLIHFSQIARSGMFQQYDYGTRRNTEVYGSSKPAVYNLSKVKVPLVMLAGQNDQLATVADAEKLSNQLSNVKQFTVLPRKQVNHLDFIWGRTMQQYLFPYIFRAL